MKNTKKNNTTTDTKKKNTATDAKKNNTVSNTKKSAQKITVSKAKGSDIVKGSKSKKQKTPEQLKASYEKRKKISIILARIVWIAQVALSGLVLYFANTSKLVPSKYMIPGTILVIVLALMTLAWTMHFLRKHQIRFYTGLAVSLIVCILCGAGSYYLHTGVSTMKKISGASKETTKFGVYVLKDNKAEKITDAKSYTFGILASLDREKTDIVITDINKDLKNSSSKSIKTREYTDMLTMSKALLDKETKAMIMNESYVQSIAETEGYEDFQDKVKEIATYDVSTEAKAASEDAAADGVFTMYVSGIDTRGGMTQSSRSDSNILAVINTKTHQILLISTPRDYYVETSVSKGQKDKLTHAGIYGVECSMKTLEKIYDTGIDYYFRVNFGGFQEIIKALGGVTVHSDYTFNSNQTTEKTYHFKEGDNYMDAEAALAFARERYAVPQGDIQRGRDQMYVIQAILNKMMSPAMLKNYSGLMKSIEGSFETSLPYDIISKLVSDQLDSGAGWDIQTYAVTGTGASKTTYSAPSSHAYVMIPDQATVDLAKTYINDVLADKTVTVNPDDAKKTTDTKSSKNTVTEPQ